MSPATLRRALKAFHRLEHGRCEECCAEGVRHYEVFITRKLVNARFELAVVAFGTQFGPGLECETGGGCTHLNNGAVGVQTETCGVLNVLTEPVEGCRELLHRLEGLQILRLERGNLEVVVCCRILRVSVRLFTVLHHEVGQGTF